VDGIFNINKATGITSHDVVARVRRLIGQRRVGHAGTLDPLASGVLPVLVGQATRLAEYLSESGKAYRATVRFGVATTTYDAEGEVVRAAPEAALALRRERIEAALPGFLGEQEQVPPIYSAIKRDGQPLYALARAGRAVTPEPRRVRIEALRIVAWQPPDLVLDVECGKGTYIRSLAYDLGERLGPGAHLAALVRTRSGPFRLVESVTLERLAAALGASSQDLQSSAQGSPGLAADFSPLESPSAGTSVGASGGRPWPRGGHATPGSLRDLLYAPDEALLERRAAILGLAAETRLRTGQVLRFDEAAAAREAGELLRAYTIDGRFLGVLRWDELESVWRPHKVLQVAPLEE
jgi:tRNA pseudouridine55 synthase